MSKELGVCPAHIGDSNTDGKKYIHIRAVLVAIGSATGGETVPLFNEVDNHRVCGLFVVPHVSGDDNKEILCHFPPPLHLLPHTSVEFLRGAYCNGFQTVSGR